MAGVDDFNREFAELLNTYCWNDIWNRPGLPRKTRSILNLGMLCALGKEHELKLHIRGALNNGLTKEEIKEVFLQTAIYCGVPAAVVAFRCRQRSVPESEKSASSAWASWATHGGEPRARRVQGPVLRSERQRKLQVIARSGRGPRR